MATRRGPITAVLAASLLLAACSSGGQAGEHAGHGGMEHGGMQHGGGGTAAGRPTAGQGSTAKANAVDLAFAEGMLPHHAQAIAMADDALARSSNAELRQLATSIKATQQPEVDQLSRWLITMGRPGKDLGPGHAVDTMAGMHAGHQMAGMVAEADLAKLKALQGKAFDQRWLELMVEHHLGAMAMAKQELAGGRNAETLGLAKAIVVSQQREVDQMRGMLATRPS